MLLIPDGGMTTTASPFDSSSNYPSTISGNNNTDYYNSNYNGSMPVDSQMPGIADLDDQNLLTPSTMKLFADLPDSVLVTNSSNNLAPFDPSNSQQWVTYTPAPFVLPSPKTQRSFITNNNSSSSHSTPAAAKSNKSTPGRKRQVPVEALNRQELAALERRRDRNRLAAAQCRKRKEDVKKALEDEVRKLNSELNQLKGKLARYEKRFGKIS